MKNKEIILGIESSGSNCSAALSIDGVLFSEYNIFEKNLHDKYLAEFVKRLINDAGLNAEDISAIAVSSGPGSFTGLRISGAIAKGFCYDERTKLIAVPTLESTANYVSLNMNLESNIEIVSTVKAHKDLLYYQLFNYMGLAIGEPIFSEIENFKKEVSSENKFICGSAGDELSDYQSIKEFNYLSARFTVAKAIELFKEQKFTNAEEYVPYYIQEFQLKTKVKE